MKSYETGALSAISNLTISKTAPSSPSNAALWLDNSILPLSLKQYNGSNWDINNDLVYIGDVTISSGVITAVKNNYFNACPAFRYPVETYQNGASWYAVYSDGWCIQGGLVSNTSGSGTVTLLKSYKDTNYLIFLQANASSGSNAYAPIVTQTKNISDFGYYSLHNHQGFADWRTEGYIS